MQRGGGKHEIKRFQESRKWLKPCRCRFEAQFSWQKTWLLPPDRSPSIIQKKFTTGEYKNVSVATEKTPHIILRNIYNIAYIESIVMSNSIWIDDEVQQELEKQRSPGQSWNGVLKEKLGLA